MDFCICIFAATLCNSRKNLFEEGAPFEKSCQWKTVTNAHMLDINKNIQIHIQSHSLEEKKTQTLH